MKRVPPDCKAKLLVKVQLLIEVSLFKIEIIAKAPPLPAVLF
jgi:hypothetical protein